MKRQEYLTLYEMEEAHWWYLGHRHLYAYILNRYCPLAARGRVLDAGCGSGGFTQWLRDSFSPERLVGMEISEDALERCRERGLEDLLCCSVEDIGLADESFDLVVCLNVLYHREVRDDLGALRELSRVLSPGGYLLLNLPALPMLSGSHDLAVEGARRYRAPEIREKLALAGLEPVRVTYFVFFLLPLIAAYRLWSRRKANQGARSDLWLPPAPVNRALQRLLESETRLIRLRDLPLGSSLTALARKSPR